MGIIGEFKKFIARGNVLNLAVGVIIGAAFGKIVTSLTESLIMPVIGWIFGNLDFSNWFVRLGPLPEGYAGSPTDYAKLKEAGVAMFGYGDFLTQMLNFLIVAFALFLMVKVMNRVVDEMHRKQRECDDTSASDEVVTDPQLDVLKQILKELQQKDAKAAG